MGIYLDEKVNFKKHIENKLCKVSEGISVIKNPRHTFKKNQGKKSLLTIYKAFLRKHTDC